MDCYFMTHSVDNSSKVRNVEKEKMNSFFNFQEASTEMRRTGILLLLCTVCELRASSLQEK